MNGKHWLFVMCLGIVACFAAASSSFSYDIVRLDNDAAYLSLKADILFIAEGRIGDRTGNATFELDIQDGGHDVQASYRQGGWTSGTWVPFSISYASGGVTFSSLDQTLTWSGASGSITDIFMRTAAYKDGSSMELGALTYNGTAISPASLIATPSDNQNYLWIRGIEPATDSFTLTGESIMTWGTTTPKNSELAYQIKVGRVPIPGAVWLLASAIGPALGVGVIRSRRSARRA
jgi:hypothetical protein